MGLLSDMGPILPYEQGAKVQPQLKIIAIKQFVNVFKKYMKWEKSADNQRIKWGEQIQGNFLQYDEDGSLKLCKSSISQQYSDLKFPLMFQYGSFMFEMIPSQPYNTGCNLDESIRQIRYKYSELHKRSRIALTIPVIPFLGVRDPKKQKKFVNTITQSQYIDDDHIASHPRFPTLTKNIRTRRNHTVDIRVPLFIDQKTDFQQIRKTNEPYDGFIYLDAMAFGMGLSCLQCTFSTKSLDHARYVYDQLNVLSPIFLALTAGTPFHKGKVSDWDARWNIISGSVDDRPQQQRDPTNERYIPDSRYSSTNLFIWNGKQNLPEYNDYNLHIKQTQIDFIKQKGKNKQVEIDDLLAKHIANIMKRDILIVHEKFTSMEDTQVTLFQMLNGTNWNSVRLKIPIDDQIGWRVEFRTMEVQLTADQNAAYSLFIHLLMRVFHNDFSLNLYIPITKVRQNFDRAHKKDALRKQKFFFRTNILDQGPAVIEELTIHEIFFGKNDYPGIYKLFVQRLPQCCKVCEKVFLLISSIQKFLRDTTSGTRITLAQWMRKFIHNDERYKKNSILPKQVMDEMLLTLYEISNGKRQDQNFKQIFKLWEKVDLKLEDCVY